MKRIGFTFIEALVVITIFSVIVLAVYGISRGGIEIYRRSRDFSLKERKIILSLERLAEGLRRIAPLHKLASLPEDWEFKGTSEGVKQELSFIAFDKQGLRRLSYIFSQDGSELFKLQLIQEDIGQGEIQLERDLVSGINKPLSGNFLQYLKYNDLDDNYEWVDVWEEGTSLPEAIKVEVDCLAEDSDDQEPQTFTKRVFILR